MSNTMIQQPTRKWEDLPKELLRTITNHLDSRIDVFRFRSVSSSWRSLLSPSFLSHSSNPPLTLPPPFTSPVRLNPLTICRLENLPKTSACLVKVTESDSGELQLLSIPTAETQTPHFLGTSIRRSLNMLNFRLIEIFKAHVLCYDDIAAPVSKNFKKVVVFRNLGILVLYNYTGNLAFWGFDDKDWTNLGQEGAHYDDIILFKNDQYYVVDNLGIVSWIDSSLNLIQYSPPLCGFGQMKSLVECDGCFYIVDSYMDEEGGVSRLYQPPPQLPNVGQFWVQDRRTVVDMKLYKLDEEWGMWVQVKSLGDRVFVLGKEVNVAVNVGEYPGCQGNCVYFIDKSDRTQTRRMLVPRFFRLEDGCIRFVESFPTYKRLFSPAMTSFFSKASDDIRV